ncbi:MAG: hypothetical protein HIU84_11815 [Acidobacteria bacterium]|nr:hypothetical protein [Acidobacteriota bacterium]
MTSEPLNAAEPVAFAAKHYSSFNIDRPDELPRSGFRYWHFAGTDETHPGILNEARRLHGEGYHSAGLVNELAIDRSGRMAPTVDKTLGLPCRYYVAVDPEETSSRSTARKVLTDSSDDYFGLPGVRLCHDHLHPSGLHRLRQHRDVGPVVEISALARSDGAGAGGVHEIICRMLIEGISDNELWFTALVPSTLRQLQLRYGQHSWQVIGDDVPVEDEGVIAGVHLRPVVVEPSRVINTMRQEADQVDSVRMRDRLRREVDHFEEVRLETMRGNLSNVDRSVSDE